MVSSQFCSHFSIRRSFLWIFEVSLLLLLFLLYCFFSSSSSPKHIINELNEWMVKTYTHTYLYIYMCIFCRKISKNRFLGIWIFGFCMFENERLYIIIHICALCECSKGKENDMRYERTHRSKKEKKTKDLRATATTSREKKMYVFFSLFVCSLCGKQDSN